MCDTAAIVAVVSRRLVVIAVGKGSLGETVVEEVWGVEAVIVVEAVRSCMWMVAYGKLVWVAHNQPCVEKIFETRTTLVSLDRCYYFLCIADQPSLFDFGPLCGVPSNVEDQVLSSH